MKALLLLITATIVAFGEADLRTAKSPDGQVEFRIFFEPQKDDYIRLAYQIKYKGKLMMDTSYMGVVIHDQPLLGQYAGLISAVERAENGYTHLQTEYMQNGTLGRRLAVDTRSEEHTSELQSH